MITVRQFNATHKMPVPRPGARGLHAVVVQLPADAAGRFTPEELTRRYNGSPLVIDRENAVVALYFDPYSEMDEHDAREPILCMVTGGKGHCRIGGPDGKTVELTAGTAILWPAHVLHKVWTYEEAMQAIVVHYTKEVSAE
ncbi:MAG: hypothetical protein NVSMB52_16680 [Chloroflexota bacterium]